MGGRARRIQGWPPIEIFPVRSVRRVANLTSLASAAGAPLFSSRPCGHNAALCVSGLFADDVDYTIYSIGAPQGRARTTDHFNAIDVFEQYVLNIPVYAGQQRRIYVSAFDGG